MTQETLVFIFGIVIFLIPFLGIPTEWKFYAVSSFGLLLVVIGYRLRYRRAVRELNSKTTDSVDKFVQMTKPLFESRTDNK